MRAKDRQRKAKKSKKKEKNTSKQAIFSLSFEIKLAFFPSLEHPSFFFLIVKWEEWQFMKKGCRREMNHKGQTNHYKDGNWDCLPVALRQENFLLTWFHFAFPRFSLEMCSRWRLAVSENNYFVKQQSQISKAFEKTLNELIQWTFWFFRDSESWRQIWQASSSFLFSSSPARWYFWKPLK